MASLLSALEARANQAVERVEELRKQIDALAVQLEEAESWLGRLEITRETVRAVLDEQLTAGESVSAGSEPGVAQSVSATPGYEQIARVLAEARGPLRCKEILLALQWDTESRHVEGVRSKLQRMEARGLVVQVGAGLFKAAGTGER